MPSLKDNYEEWMRLAVDLHDNPTKLSRYFNDFNETMTFIAETGFLPGIIAMQTDDFINRLPTLFISSFLRINKPDEQQLASIILFLQAILKFSIVGMRRLENEIIDLAITILSNQNILSSQPFVKV
jgi:hypothetical protein